MGDLIAQLEPEKKDLTDWYKREWWLVVTLASGVPAAAALAVPRTYGKYFIAASVALVAIGMIMLVIREVRKPATSRE